jgi:hypothetical protein
MGFVEYISSAIKYQVSSMNYLHQVRETNHDCLHHIALLESAFEVKLIIVDPLGSGSPSVTAFHLSPLAASFLYTNVSAFSGT